MAKSKIMAARTALVLDEPFFGSLALGLELREDPGKGVTVWTDGKTLGYSPTFVSGLTHAQLTAVIAHEVMHCAAGHPWRRDGRDAQRWNQAADYAINGLLRDSGFSIPPDVLIPSGEQVGKSAEYIYSRLPEPEPKPDSGADGKQGDGAQSGAPGDSSSPSDGAGNDPSESNGDGEPVPDPLGEVRDAPTGEDSPTESDWAQAVQQAAAQAQAQGKLPGGMARFAKTAVAARIDYRATLRRFIQERARQDYSWSRPSARYLAQGLYLPALESRELGHIAIAIDTSGSIDDVSLAQVQAEITAAVAECSPTKVTIFYADSKIARRDTFERGEDIEFHPAGGGGTDFRPVFEAIAADGDPPVCLVYLTDLDGAFPADSEIPTLWITDGEQVAPFGETVKM